MSSHLFLEIEKILSKISAAFSSTVISSLLFLLINLFWRTVFLFSQEGFSLFHHTVEYTRALILGLRLDGVISGYLTIPVLITTFLPIIGWSSSVYRWIYKVYNLLSVFLISLTHLADIEFFEEFGQHLNFLLMHQKGNETELFQYLKNEYPLVEFFIILVIVTIISGWLFLKVIRIIQHGAHGNYLVQFMTFFIAFSGLVLACIGGWQERPIDWGNAIDCYHPMANQVALNGIFFLGRSVVELSSEDNIKKSLMEYPIDEANETTLDLLEREVDPTLNQDLVRPFLEPPNIMIIILESFTGALVGYLNPDSALGITPFFDQLSHNGISFTRCYSNGVRSAHGISTIASGRPVLPGLPLIYQVESMSGIPTIGSILQKRGYSTSYYYGGNANYDNMAGFLKLNGFDSIIDQDQLPANADGTDWGIFDHYLFDSVLDDSNRKSGPFLSMVFTTTNHQPWDIPNSYDSEIPVFHNIPYHRDKTARTMAYVDRVLQHFFSKASQEDWFENTIFVLTSDHGLRVNRENFDDPVNAHIPLIIYQPNFFSGNLMVNTVTSQTDILPMLLSLLGINDIAIQIWGRIPTQSSFGFACRVANDQIYWFEDQYIYKEILSQKKTLFKISPDGLLSHMEDEIIFKQMEKRCKSYLESAYYSLKNNQSLSHSAGNQNGESFVNFERIRTQKKEYD